MLEGLELPVVWVSVVWDDRRHMIGIQELASRYGISRQQIYQRLSATDLTPLKRGNRSFFTPDMVDELDRVDGLLSQGF